MVTQAVLEIESALSSGKSVTIFTARQFVADASLEDTAAVSQAITDTVRLLTVKPSFLIVKGGITSNDVAVHGLGMRTARVLGQAHPGVPVWLSDQESKFPGLQYIVFPGNVGDDSALSKVVQKLGVSLRGVNNKFHNTLTRMKKISTNGSSSSSSSGTKFHHVVSALQSAETKGFALAAFNVYNLEGASAVIRAAEKLNSAVILQV
jgi:hypothetical protein